MEYFWELWTESSISYHAVFATNNGEDYKFKTMTLQKKDHMARFHFMFLVLDGPSDAQKQMAPEGSHKNMKTLIIYKIGNALYRGETVWKI